MSPKSKVDLIKPADPKKQTHLAKIFRDSTGPSHIPFDRGHPEAGLDAALRYAQVGGTSPKMAIKVRGSTPKIPFFK